MGEGERRSEYEDRNNFSLFCMPAYKIATPMRYVPEVHSSNIGKNTDYVTVFGDFHS